MARSPNRKPGPKPPAPQLRAVTLTASQWRHVAQAIVREARMITESSPRRAAVDLAAQAVRDCAGVDCETEITLTAPRSLWAAICEALLFASPRMGRLIVQQLSAHEVPEDGE